MKEAVISSSVLITAVLILRTIFKGRISSRARYGLWLIAAIRLMLPFGLMPSYFSVMNLAPQDRGAQISPAVIPEELSHNTLPEYHEEISYNNQNLDLPAETAVTEISMIPERESIAEMPVTEEKENDSLSVKQVIRIVYFSVMGAMAVWFVFVNISFYIRLRKNRRRTDYDHKLKIYAVKGLRSPCIFGRSIYLTEEAAKSDSISLIIAHEYCHYLHGDIFWTILRSALLCIYWFDPFVWAAAVISKRDCEAACDEGAIKLLGEEKRYDYGRTLVDMVSKNGGELFGVASTSMSAKGNALKERVRLISKKPRTAVLAVLVSASAVIITAGCTFTSAKEEIPAAPADAEKLMVFFEDCKENLHDNGNRYFYAQAMMLPAEKGGYELSCNITNLTDFDLTARVTGDFVFAPDGTDIPENIKVYKAVPFSAGKSMSLTFPVKEISGNDADTPKALSGKITLEFEENAFLPENVNMLTFTAGSSGGYYPNIADTALRAYARTYENYSEYYENGAVSVYLDPMLPQADKNGQFCAVSNLWIKYADGSCYNVPLRFSRDTESWYAETDARKVSYISTNGTLLDKEPFEDIVNRSWENYIKEHHGGYKSDRESMDINGEKVTDIYALPVEINENMGASAGIIYVSGHYHLTSPLMYYPDNPYGFEDDWNWKGTGMPPMENDGEFYERLKSCKRIGINENIPEKSFHKGDTVYSFRKVIPTERSSSAFTVELVMTEENYDGNVSRNKNELQGSFALRISDSRGNITGEQPLKVQRINCSKEWNEQYFRFGNDISSIMTFTEHIGYNEGHRYLASFFGITEKGELFPYHIVEGEFEGDICEGDRMRIRVINTIAQPHTEDTFFGFAAAGNDPQNEQAVFLLFDKKSHTVRNFASSYGEQDRDVLEAAKEAISVNSSIMTLSLGVPLEDGENCIEEIDRARQVGYYELDRSIAVSEEGLIEYIADRFTENYYNKDELRSLLFDEHREKFGSDTYSLPYFKMCDGKLCYLNVYNGAGGYFGGNAVIKRIDEGSCIVYYELGQVDYYEMRGMLMKKCPDGKWRADGDIEI